MVCVNDIFGQMLYLMVSLGLIWKCWEKLDHLELH